MLTSDKNTVKIYTFTVRGGICAQVRTRKDGMADLFIAARGSVETLPTAEAFTAAKARKRLEA